MQVKVKALSNVAHGRFNMTRGQEFTVSKGESEELRSIGMVQIVEDEQPAQAEQAAEKQQMTAKPEAVQPEAEAKMADAPENKMEAAPENKSEPATEEEKPVAGKPARKSTAKKAD